jgi:hypothetical protein
MHCNNIQTAPSHGTRRLGLRWQATPLLLACVGDHSKKRRRRFTLPAQSMTRGWKSERLHPRCTGDTLLKVGWHNTRKRFFNTRAESLPALDPVIKTLEYKHVRFAPGFFTYLSQRKFGPAIMALLEEQARDGWELRGTFREGIEFHVHFIFAREAVSQSQQPERKAA